MGCSTKIATGLGWGLPLLTTAAGLRGYTWNEGNVPIYSTPGDLANAAVAVLDLSCATAIRNEVIRAVRSVPTRQQIAIQIRRDLGVDSTGRLSEVLNAGNYSQWGDTSESNETSLFERSIRPIE
jgi:hypothetical protein